MVGAHGTLESRGGARWVRQQALARGGADQNGAVFVHANRRRRQYFAQAIWNKNRTAILPHRGQAVRGSEVDTNYHGLLAAGSLAQGKPRDVFRFEVTAQLGAARQNF